MPQNDRTDSVTSTANGPLATIVPSATYLLAATRTSHQACNVKQSKRAWGRESGEWAAAGDVPCMVRSAPCVCSSAHAQTARARRATSALHAIGTTGMAEGSGSRASGVLFVLRSNSTRSGADRGPHGAAASAQQSMRQHRKHRSPEKNIHWSCAPVRAGASWRSSHVRGTPADWDGAVSKALLGVAVAAASSSDS